MRFLDLIFRERTSCFSLEIKGDPTVDGFRDKKESCSTRKGLRVGTRFKEFRQTPRGRGFFLLGFILCLRTMLMLELVDAVGGRLIGPRTWDRIVWIYGT